MKGEITKTTTKKKGTCTKTDNESEPDRGG